MTVHEWRPLGAKPLIGYSDPPCEDPSSWSTRRMAAMRFLKATRRVNRVDRHELSPQCTH